MKEFIEKLIGRLEEKFKYNSEQAEIWRNGSDKDAYFRGQKDLYMDRANTYGEVMRIVNQLAEEYNNGWIPVSDGLPKEDMQCWATFESGNVDKIQYLASLKWWNGEMGDNKVIAWMPLPEPFKPKGEQYEQ